MSTRGYTPLHVHSEYSLLDGLSSCADIADRTAKLGSSACSITDHGGVSAAIDFSKEMRDLSLKPILGSELYICTHSTADIKNKDNRSLSHQVVLAKNHAGWKDLLSIITTANNPAHFYYRPRIDLDILGKQAEKGNLVSFSGHLGSVLSNAIAPNDVLSPDWKSNGIKVAKKLENMFGKGNFFIEIQLIDSLNNPLAKTVANALREIAIATDIPCVATPDAHYCTREDADDQRVLLSTYFKKSIAALQREVLAGTASNTIKTFFGSNNFHIPSYEDMIQFHTDEELQNTNVIRDMCEDYSILKSPDPPEFTCPSGFTPNDYLKYLCREGWKKKMGHIDNSDELFNTYGERVKHELEVFTSVGLSSYFLIIRDILDYVRGQDNLVGCGRGSSAGCMISYLLGITQVDPIKYNLLLERFYNAGRNSPGHVSWPDIDFDVPKAAREDAVEYIRNKYGKDNVAQIITFQTLKGRAALTRVMSSRDIPFVEQKRITKYLPDEASVTDELVDIKKEYGIKSTILWTLEHTSKKLKEWCELESDGTLSGPMAKVFEQAIRLEGTKIIAGKHPAGVLISKTPITEQCPMVLDNKAQNLLAGFDKPEEVGLLKLDCLAIRGLDKIMDVVSIASGKIND